MKDSASSTEEKDVVMPDQPLDQHSSNIVPEKQADLTDESLVAQQSQVSRAPAQIQVPTTTLDVPELQQPNFGIHPADIKRRLRDNLRVRVKHVLAFTNQSRTLQIQD